MMISIELKLYRCPLNWTIHNLGYNFVYSPHGREEGCWLSTPKVVMSEIFSHPYLTAHA